MASAIQATKAPARKGSLACYRWYPKVSRIQAKAAQDVGRGSETLMTFARGDLFKAARRFVSGESRKALVVTGFYIPKAEHPAAESDGPVGATEICAAIRDIGGDAWLVSDAWCEPVIRGAAKDVLPQDHVLIAPKGDSFDAWLDGTKTLIAEQHIDTVIFIERVGPASDGYPRNMRGINILEWTAPLSRLASLGLHTIAATRSAWDTLNRMRSRISSTMATRSPAPCPRRSSSWPDARIGAAMRSFARSTPWAIVRSPACLTSSGIAACSRTSRPPAAWTGSNLSTSPRSTVCLNASTTARSTPYPSSHAEFD